MMSLWGVGILLGTIEVRLGGLETGNCFDGLLKYCMVVVILNCWLLSLV